MIAVAGATGTVGRHVVAALESAGHPTRPLSRSAGVDVVAGVGLADALRGVDAVIDVLNITTASAERSARFFEATTTALLEAEAEAVAGVGHHVALSIVGIDAAPSGYYAGKLAQERLVTRGSVPWTILRATQFHEFAGQVLDAASIGPVSFVPLALLRPVAASEVGAVLAEIAAGPSRLAVESLRGPRDERLTDMARRVLAARGHRRAVVPMPLPGGLGRAMRGGLLRGAATDRAASITFADWLASIHN